MKLNPNPVITTDLDGVAADFTSPFVKFWNIKYGTSFSATDFRHHTLSKTFGVDHKPYVSEALEQFYLTEEFKNLPTVPGSVAGFAELSKKYTVIGLTSRPSHLKEDTERWLNEKFRGNIPSVYFSTKQETKRDICRDVSAEYHIEDNLDYAVEVSAGGIDTILVDSPWNDTKSDHFKELFPSGELPGGIIRAGDWRRGINPWSVITKIL